MLSIIWDTRGYFFWMLIISVSCFLAERIAPWRREQVVLRPQLAQDFFWLVFNAHYAGLLIGFCAGRLLDGLTGLTQWAGGFGLLADSSLILQIFVFFVAKDFLEWCVHNLLHRIPWLWTFHKVHHSIEIMDWIGNFRFHWMEIVVYKSLTYFPLVILGIDSRVILWIAILTTIIGHLNHSNLDISWGWLRYLLNSSRMHIWHHMRNLPHDRQHGLNFGISLSLWDWLFRTSYWPGVEESIHQQPDNLGCPGLRKYPTSLFGRIFVPFSLIRRG